MGKFCGHCGAELKENAEKCEKCGYPVEESLKKQGQESTLDKETKRPDRKKIGILTAIVLLLGVAIIFAVAAKNQPQEDTEALNEKPVQINEWWMKADCEESEENYADAVLLHFRKDGIVEYTNYQLDAEGNFAEERISGEAKYELYSDKVVFDTISLSVEEDAEVVTMELVKGKDKTFGLKSMSEKEESTTEKLLSGKYFKYDWTKYEKDIMKELCIPEDAEGEFAVSEPDYWYAGDTWKSLWEYFVGEEEECRAMCTIDCENGEVISDICIYEDPTAEEEPVEEPVSETADTASVYKQVLQKIANENNYPDMFDEEEYIVYDLDGNGVSELVVRNYDEIGLCQWSVYTVSGGQAKLLGNFDGIHTYLKQCTTGGLYSIGASGGGYYTEFITINGGVLKVESDYGDYLPNEGSGLTPVPVTDMSLL